MSRITRLAFTGLTLVGTALPALAATPAHAATRSGCTTPASAPSKASIVHRPVSTLHFADGGMETVFDLGGGAQVRFPVPPPGFDPTTASAGELDKYAFPPRPSDPIALGQWRGSVAHMTITPTLSVTTRPIVNSGTTGKSSTNWSGVVDQAPSNATPPYFKQIIGDYTQPNVQAPTCSGSAWSGWVGLGGYTTIPNNQNLLQAGTQWDASQSPGDNYKIFFELYPAITETLVDYQMPAGHLVEASITDLQTLPVPVKNSFDWSVWDKTANSGRNGQVTYTGGFPTDLSAEWIDERPGGVDNGAVTTKPLANFGTDSWSFSDVIPVSGGAGNAASFSPVELTMINSYTANPATTLSQPSALTTNGTFSDTYKACS